MKNITVTPEKIPFGKKAMVVIVHDDGDRDTVRYLRTELEKYDLCATIALVADRVVDEENKEIPENVAFWRDMVDTGRFSISSHSRTHTFWGTTDEAESGVYLLGGTLKPYSIPAGKLSAEIRESREILKSIFPDQRLRVFVKPGGWCAADGVKFSPKAQNLLYDTYIAMRDTGGGVTEIPFPNPYRINSHMVMPNETPEQWNALLNEAIEKNALIVYLFHNIVPENATGITVLQSAADALFAYIGEKKKAGEVYCTFLEDAVVYAEEYRSARIVTQRKGERLLISSICPLDPSVYDLPLTARMMCPDGTTRFVQIPMNGEPISPSCKLKKENLP